MIVLNRNIIDSAMMLLDYSEKKECGNSLQKITNINEEITQLKKHKENLKSRCKELMLNPTAAIIKEAGQITINDAIEISALMQVNLWKDTL